MASGLHPLSEFSGVSTVSPDRFEMRKAPSRFFQDQFRSITILNRSGVDNKNEQESHCVSQNMALAALDLFASIIPTLTTLFGRLDTLAINNAGTRLSVTTFGEAELWA